jgi:uncharacterized protein (DUF1800 family)
MNFYKSRTTFGIDAEFKGILPLKAYTNQDYPAPGDPDEAIPFGQPWTGTTTKAAGVLKARRETIKSAIVEKMLWNGDINARMWFFWHNHFGVPIEKLQNPQIALDFYELLARDPQGDFRKLIIHVVYSAGMQIFLDGNQNRVGTPNVNLAREVMELFTLGRGNYTEEDINQAARLLTGYQVNEMGQTIFMLSDHDQGQCQFSEHFQNANIQGFANHLIDLIFEKQPTTVAKFICGKLYRYLISSEIDQDVVIAMAADLIRDNWNIGTAINTLFNTPMDLDHEGCKVKSPIELLAKVVRDFEIPIIADVQARYWVIGLLRRELVDMGMDLGDPPSVKGWQPLYLEPTFDQDWYNPATAMIRHRFLESVFNPWWYSYGDHSFHIDALAVISKVSNPQDPNVVVAEIIDRCFPIPVTAEERNQVKTDCLLSGLDDDRYWTNAWNAYTTNPDERNTSRVAERAKSLLLYIVNHQNYQLL